MSARRLLLAVFLAAVLAHVVFDLGRFLNLDYFRTQQASIEAWTSVRPVAAALAFFLTYVVVTVLSLPGTAIAMTLAAGALFGLFWGTVLVSFASSIGATLAFLAARFLLRDWVQRNFSERLRAVNAGIEKEGGFYLFSVRLIPLFPFFAVNLVMGLTPMRTHTFYWVSQVGMLAGTFVYINAGTQLAHVESLAGIVAPGVLASFAVLGVFPLLARRMLRLVARRRGR